MKKILILCVGFFLYAPVFADDVAPAVKSRTTDCPSVRAEIDSLSKIADPDEVTVARLDELNATYRADCGVQGSGRRGSGRAATVVVNTDAEILDDDAESDDDADMEIVIVDDADDNATAAETDAEIAARIAANVAAGLCPDGDKPNKFGCCAGERFTDMGNLVFKCCTRDRGECVDPRK